MRKDVLPFVPDAVVDETAVDTLDEQIGIVGYEVNFNRYFYKFVPPRNPQEISTELMKLEEKCAELMKELFNEMR